MSRLPVISGRAAVAALTRMGCVVRQKGSHVRMRHLGSGTRQPVTVPDHKELKDGTLRAIIRDAGASVDEFCEFLR